MNWKSLTDAEIHYLLDGEQFKTPPMRHQQITLAMSTSRPRLFAWNDIGTGKSLIGVYAHQVWRSKRVLVVCPNCVVEGWRDQIAEHSDWQAEILTGPTAKRRTAIASSTARIFVINYEGLQYLFGQRIKQGRTSKWHKDSASIHQANFDGLVIDEAHHVANKDSIQTRCCRMLSEQANQVLLLTGTPLKTVDDKGVPVMDPSIWTMYDVLDGGFTLGASRNNFLRQHYTKSFWGDWTVKPGHCEKILERIAPATIRFSRAECFDLPERTYEERFANMMPEQIRLTDKLIGQESINTPEGILGPQDATSLANKLLQVAGGMLIMEDKAVHRLKKNPKLDLLLEILRELDRAVVFHNYVAEGRAICESLTALGIKYEAMRGDIKDRNGWRRFNEDPAIRVLVAHPAAGGEGLNLQDNCSTMIFFSNGMLGAAAREQAEGRIWRAGQRNACLYLDLVLRGSVDEQRLQKTKDRTAAIAKIMAFVEGRRADKRLIKNL